MDENKTGLGSGTEGGGRGDRSLGRGLADVSHLFLSGKSPEPAVPEHSSPGAVHRPAPPARSRPGAVLLGPTAALTREQLAPLLKEFHGALEEGLTSIDADIPCPPCGEIDLLGLSRANQLTIIDFDTKADDGLLTRGIAHVDWITRSMPIVRRMYPGQAINYSLPPALVLVAPHFSPVLRSVARQIARPTIKWVRYTAVESSAGLGIFFERIDGE